MMTEMMLNFLVGCLEIIKINLLLYFMTAIPKREGLKKIPIIFLAIVVEAVSFMYFGGNIVSYFIMVITVICVLWKCKWYMNIFWSCWSITIVAMIDFFWGTLFRFKGYAVGTKEDLFDDIIKGILSMIVIVILGEIYRKINQGRVTLQIMYYTIFLITGTLNGILLEIYVEGMEKEYMSIEGTPAKAIACVGLCVVGFLFEMYAILILGSLMRIKKEREELQEEIILAQKEHFTDLEMREEDTRRFRHDINDHIYIIKQLLSEGKYEDASHYIDSTSEMLDSLKKVSVGNNAVDAVLSQYIRIAQNENVQLNITGKLPYEINVSDYDICTIISNILRNAIAASGETGKVIDLQIRYDESFIYIREGNTCDKKLVIDNTIPKSTKNYGSHKGYGLRNIQNVAEKNGGTVTIYAKNGEYVIDVLLKNVRERA